MFKQINLKIIDKHVRDRSFRPIYPVKCIRAIDRMSIHAYPTDLMDRNEFPSVQPYFIHPYTMYSINHLFIRKVSHVTRMCVYHIIKSLIYTSLYRLL